MTYLQQNPESVMRFLRFLACCYCEGERVYGLSGPSLSMEELRCDVEAQEKIWESHKVTRHWWMYSNLNTAINDYAIKRNILIYWDLLHPTIIKITKTEQQRQKRRYQACVRELYPSLSLWQQLWNLLSRIGRWMKRIILQRPWMMRDECPDPIHHPAWREISERQLRDGSDNWEPFEEYLVHVGSAMRLKYTQLCWIQDETLRKLRFSLNDEQWSCRERESRIERIAWMHNGIRTLVISMQHYFSRKLKDPEGWRYIGYFYFWRNIYDLCERGLSLHREHHPILRPYPIRYRRTLLRKQAIVQQALVLPSFYYRLSHLEHESDIQNRLQCHLVSHYRHARSLIEEMEREILLMYGARAFLMIEEHHRSSSDNKEIKYSVSAYDLLLDYQSLDIALHARQRLELLQHQLQELYLIGHQCLHPDRYPGISPEFYGWITDQSQWWNQSIKAERQFLWTMLTLVDSDRWFSDDVDNLNRVTPPWREFQWQRANETMRPSQWPSSQRRAQIKNPLVCRKVGQRVPNTWYWISADSNATRIRKYPSCQGVEIRSRIREYQSWEYSQSLLGEKNNKVECDEEIEKGILECQSNYVKKQADYLKIIRQKNKPWRYKFNNFWSHYNMSNGVRNCNCCEPVQPFPPLKEICDQLQQHYGECIKEIRNEITKILEENKVNEFLEEIYFIPSGYDFFLPEPSQWIKKKGKKWTVETFVEEFLDKLFDQNQVIWGEIVKSFNRKWARENKYTDIKIAAYCAVNEIMKYLYKGTSEHPYIEKCKLKDKLLGYKNGELFECHVYWMIDSKEYNFLKEWHGYLETICEEFIFPSPEEIKKQLLEIQEQHVNRLRHTLYGLAEKYDVRYRIPEIKKILTKESYGLPKYWDRKGIIDFINDLKSKLNWKKSNGDKAKKKYQQLQEKYSSRALLDDTGFTTSSANDAQSEILAQAQPSSSNSRHSFFSHAQNILDTLDEDKLKRHADWQKDEKRYMSMARGPRRSFRGFQKGT